MSRSAGPLRIRADLEAIVRRGWPDGMGKKKGAAYVVDALFEYVADAEADYLGRTEAPPERTSVEIRAANTWLRAMYRWAVEEGEKGWREARELRRQAVGLRAAMTAE